MSFGRGFYFWAFSPLSTDEFRLPIPRGGTAGFCSFPPAVPTAVWLGRASGGGCALTGCGNTRTARRRTMNGSTVRSRSLRRDSLRQRQQNSVPEIGQLYETAVGADKPHSELHDARPVSIAAKLNCGGWKRGRKL